MTQSGLKYVVSLWIPRSVVPMLGGGRTADKHESRICGLSNEGSGLQVERVSFLFFDLFIIPALMGLESSFEVFAK